MKTRPKLFAALSLLFFCFISATAYSEGASRSVAETEWIGDQIFNNECARNVSKLVTWNEGEDFPSLGIGHFIWYPESHPSPFDESFPKLLAFFESKGVALPGDLKLLRSKHAPWKTRAEFIGASGGAEMMALREFLSQTENYQAEFLSERFLKSIPKIIEVVPRDSRHEIQKKLALMIAATGGLYPLVDYVNFKGEGMLQSERYQGQGWGLLQILEEMKIPNVEKDAIGEFVRAAEVILDKRVSNSPPERSEIRWLKGWKIRIRTYFTGQRHGEPLANSIFKNHTTDVLQDRVPDLRWGQHPIEQC